MDQAAKLGKGVSELRSKALSFLYLGVGSFMLNNIMPDFELKVARPVCRAPNVFSMKMDFTEVLPFE